MHKKDTFILSVIVCSDCRILQFLRQMLITGLMRFKWILGNDLPPFCGMFRMQAETDMADIVRNKTDTAITITITAVWQWQPKLVQTVQQHCLVWIYLYT